MRLFAFRHTISHSVLDLCDLIFIQFLSKCRGFILSAILALRRTSLDSVLKHLEFLLNYVLSLGGRLLAPLNALLKLFRSPIFIFKTFRTTKISFFLCIKLDPIQTIHYIHTMIARNHVRSTFSTNSFTSRCKSGFPILL